MNRVVAGLVCLLLVGVSQGQEFPKPGPEHEMLKKLEGVWEATVKSSFEPGKPPTESKGTATYKMECQGLWLSGDFRGSFGGMPFQGKGLDSYDPGKKKYVGVWVDSMGGPPMISEGTYDKDKKTLTMTSDYPGPDGKPTKFKMVTEYKDNDNFVFTMSAPGPGGKEAVVMTIVYKRKK